MAQLAVAIAINIAIALAINALFPPPDIEQNGPRLADLDFTGASYGKFINITTNPTSVPIMPYAGA